MTMLDQFLRSFAFATCNPHQAPVDILRQRMAEPALTGAAQ
jgi:hypothetical protein